MSKNIVDLDKIVEQRAYNFYKHGRWFPKKKKNLKITYDWSGVKFIPEEPVYHNEAMNDTEIENIIFKSTFTNNNKHNQQQTLSAQKETTSSVTTIITKGYTTGIELGLSLAAPGDIANASVGFSKGYSIDNTTESTDQRTLVWTADGTLTVGANSIVTAELKITEKKRSFTFTTRVAVEGTVKAVFHTPKNKFIMEYTGDMRSIILTDKNIPDALVDEEGDKVFLKVEGKCGFKYGIEQEIVVT